MSDHQADAFSRFACVKQAAARANAEIGALDRGKADLIDRACEERPARDDGRDGDAAQELRDSYHNQQGASAAQDRLVRRRALIPYIGYGAASKLAREALAKNANIGDPSCRQGRKWWVRPHQELTAGRDLRFE